MKICYDHRCNGIGVVIATKWRFYLDNDNDNDISITLLQISLKLHEHRRCYWRKKLSWMIFEEQFPVLRYTAASKIGNSVISLLWQLRCRCNPDHNKFSSLSNTTVVAIFQNVCLWRRSLCSNLGGVDPEKLYRATLTTRRAVACCRSAVSAWWLGQPCLHHLHVICTAFPGGLSLRLAFGSFFSFFYPHPSSPFIFPVINQCDMCLVSFAWGLMVGRRGFTRG